MSFTGVVLGLIAISTAGLLAGVDEAGRGPLAGPVVAAAVILDPDGPRINGIRDSKLLTADQRESLAARIRERALYWGVGRADHEEIDRLNILEATLLAMERAVAALGCVPERVLVDGNRLPRHLPCAAECIIGGDARVRAIGAASIIAKTVRDAEMCALDAQYPQWGFSIHKGYSTPAHLAALAEHGPSPVHRRSFAPVQRCLDLVGMP
ncbi:MAG: ribonuclease HII [Xanthomonadaceae bacterium]|nr:ribonuclease HII [Xanthomonadaceae bacterium]